MRRINKNQIESPKYPRSSLQQHCNKYKSKPQFVRNVDESSKNCLVSNKGENKNNVTDLKNNSKKEKRKNQYLDQNSMKQIVQINKFSYLKTKSSNKNKNSKDRIDVSQKRISDNLKNDKRKIETQMKINIKLNKTDPKIQCNSQVKLMDLKANARNYHMKIKLQNMLSQKTEEISSKNKKVSTLRECMMQRLKSARFRYLNEQMYSQTGKDAQMFFETDPESFKAYHEGYQQQVQKWPVNPVDNIISDIQKMPASYVIADLGCGDAKIAKSVHQTVHSFDLVAVNDLVTTCDMANLPLRANSIDMVVFCLSLMGTNLTDYLCECNRILIFGGIVKIVEVESRVENVENFIKQVQSFGFNNILRDFSHNLFYFLDFKKVANVNNKKISSVVNLKPCLYKKR